MVARNANVHHDSTAVTEPAKYRLVVELALCDHVVLAPIPEVVRAVFRCAQFYSPIHHRFARCSWVTHVADHRRAQRRSRKRAPCRARVSADMGAPLVNVKTIPAGPCDMPRKGGNVPLKEACAHVIPLSVLRAIELTPTCAPA